MMQLANVDIRRLQFLNDSINRTIEALNQVRLSAYGTVIPNAFGVTPAFGGLAHAAAVQNPYFNNFNNPLANQFTNQFSNQFTNPYSAFATAAGLGHSAFNAAYADPYSTARIAQALPFAQWGYQPFGWTTI